MKQKSGAKDLVIYSFTVVFANDNIIDADDLAMMEKIALRAGGVDYHER